MARVDVSSEAAVVSILQAIAYRLGDWRGVWSRVEKALPAEQRRFWDAGLGRRFRLHPRTVKARRKRRGYYRNPPSGRARPDGPFLEWTGSLRESVSKFTDKQRLRAKIDGARNYRGPNKANPMLPLTKRRIEPFDQKQLPKLLEAAMEDWLRQDVLEDIA